MIGNFLTRGLVMIFGYAYPAYECFKTVEKNKPDLEQLRFWCQYWILVAVMTVLERFSDNFFSWVPMYYETKLAFVIYLWYPKTKGTAYVYDSFFRPYVAKHEPEIDRNLLELRTRAGDMVFMYFQKVASYGQTRVFEILQYVAAQSTPRPRTAQPQQVPRTRQPPATATAPQQPAAKAQAPQAQTEEPLSPTSSTSSSQQEQELEEDVSSTQSQSSSATAPPSPAPAALKKSTSMPVPPEGSSQSAAKETEEKQIKPAAARVEKPVARSPSVPEETAMDEAIRVTRGRLRKTRSTVTK